LCFFVEKIEHNLAQSQNLSGDATFIGDTSPHSLQKVKINFEPDVNILSMGLIVA
jgi:hypothetical protein